MPKKDLKVVIWKQFIFFLTELLFWWQCFVIMWTFNQFCQGKKITLPHTWVVNCIILSSHLASKAQWQWNIEDNSCRLHRKYKNISIYFICFKYTIKFFLTRWITIICVSILINEIINTCIYSISQEMQACGQIPAFSLYLLSLFDTISLYPSLYPSQKLSYWFK